MTSTINASTINALRDLGPNDQLHVRDLVLDLLRHDSLMTRLEATQKALRLLGLPALAV